MTQYIASKGAGPQPAKVLVVDDDAGIRRLLARMVTSFGYAVREVPSAVEALEVMDSAPADILLCDIAMPGYDGLWLLRQAGGRWPHTAIVIVTAHQDAPTVEASRKMGAVAYVTKPIVPYMLQQALEDGLAQIQRTRSIAPVGDPARSTATDRSIEEPSRIVYSIDPRLGTTFVLWHGTVTADDLLAHVRRLTADPGWPPDEKRQLSDLRTAILDASIDTDVLRAAAELLGRNPEISNLRAAAIVAPESFEKAGLFERFVTPYGPFVFVFITLDPASAWLGIDAAEAERALRTLRRQVGP
jgi:CheY-like chemotaxis protein